MKELATSRLTLVLSLLAVALSAVALVLTLGEPRARAAPAGAPGVQGYPRDEALVAEVETIRGQIDWLRSTLDRVAAGEGRREAPVELASTAAGTGAAPEASEPHPDDGNFLLRTRLLRSFHELDEDDRKDALEELAELARWGDAEALALIAKSLSDPSSDVRARALKELASIDRAHLAEHLEQMVADTSGKVREVVADRLAKLPQSQAGPMLLGLLKDRDKDVVLAAIRSIDDLEYAEARPLLTEQLGAADLEVATRAATALRALGDESAMGGMIERVMRDFSAGDVSARVDDVKLLRRLRAERQLATILDSDPSLAVREEARNALAQLED